MLKPTVLRVISRLKAMEVFMVESKKSAHVLKTTLSFTITAWSKAGLEQYHYN